MNCICCKNQYKVCVSVCSTGATIELPVLAMFDIVYYLDLEYQGAIHTVSNLQTTNENLKFNFLPNELNEDYCYTALIYYINQFGKKIIVTFENGGVNYDCLQICTTLNV